MKKPRGSPSLYLFAKLSHYSDDIDIPFQCTVQQIQNMDIHKHTYEPTQIRTTQAARGSEGQ